VASFLASASQEKYYTFLICSQEKHLHFQEKCQEKSGKNIGKMRMNLVLVCKLYSPSQKSNATLAVAPPTFTVIAWPLEEAYHSDKQ